MKIGLSTYSLHGAMARKGEEEEGKMTPLESLDWIAANGGEHVEIAAVGFHLADDTGLPEAIRCKASDLGLDISSYTVGAQFVQPTAQDLDAEIQRLLGEVEIAARLGVKRMRHDVASRPPNECGLGQLRHDMPRLVQACQTIADHAGLSGITTSVENHGFYMQQSDRVRWLIEEVNRPNFRTTLDIGNFLCVDEDPMAAARNLLPLVSHVHVKDFYRRPAGFASGKNLWFQTRGGNFLRGAIVGNGDLDVSGVLKLIKDSGYDGFVSIEYEGCEDCRLGSRLGIQNTRDLWNAL